MTKKNQAPASRIPRYLGVFASQLLVNREYLYFWFIGVLLHIILIESDNPFVWISIALGDLAIGIAGIASVVRPVDKAFETIGLNFSAGYGLPTWKVEGKYPAAQDAIKIRAAGYAESDFASRVDQLSSRLSQPIREIKKPSAHDPTIHVVLKRSEIPKLLSFEELVLSDLKQGEFYVGKSDDGIERLSLSKMIHMLVAGQTGSGKTQFLRQFMATILAHTRHAHVCMIDMKGGIDFQHFSDLPNFELITDYDSADNMLDAVTRLFELRRDLLNKKKKSNWHELSIKELESEKTLSGQPIGPVIVTVDELAELSKKATQKASKSDLQEKIASLARLARFTGIHLVLGTQRPDKNVINMQSKDNLPTRICFAVPSVTASTLVVGDMMASTLGNIPGRAIFQLSGSKIVQTPLLEGLELEKLVSPLKAKLSAQGYARAILGHSRKHTIQNSENEVIV